MLSGESPDAKYVDKLPLQLGGQVRDSAIIQDIPTNKVVAVNSIAEGGERQNVINSTNKTRLDDLQHQVDNIVAGSAVNTSQVLTTNSSTEGFTTGLANQQAININHKEHIQDNTTAIDKTVQNLLQEIKDRENGDDDLDQKIQQEANARQTADTQEIVNRTNMVNAERDTRIAEDNKLWNAIGDTNSNKVNIYNGSRTGRHSYINTETTNMAKVEQYVSDTDRRGLEVINNKVTLYDNVTSTQSKIELTDNGTTTIVAKTLDVQTTNATFIQRDNGTTDITGLGTSKMQLWNSGALIGTDANNVSSTGGKLNITTNQLQLNGINVITKYLQEITVYNNSASPEFQFVATIQLIMEKESNITVDDIKAAIKKDIGLTSWYTADEGLTTVYFIKDTANSIKIHNGGTDYFMGCNINTQVVGTCLGIQGVN